MITPEQVVEAKRRKDAGATWRDIAVWLGRNEDHVRRTLSGQWRLLAALVGQVAVHQTEPAVFERAPETARSVAPPLTPTPHAVRPAAEKPEESGVERLFFIPDTHVPFEDGQAWAVAMAAAKAFKPDHIVLLGDFADCYSVSFHPKSPERKASLKETKAKKAKKAAVK